MKLQDMMLRTMAKRIGWYQATEILGISCRHMLRWQTRFKRKGYEELFDRPQADTVTETGAAGDNLILCGRCDVLRLPGIANRLSAAPNHRVT